MDYAKLYNALISFRKSNPLKKSKELYTEKHHIVPKCLGGSDDRENLIRLTAREHFIAHRLLAKMYPDHAGLALAVIIFTDTRVDQRVHNKEYERLRKLSSEVQSERCKMMWSDREFRSFMKWRMSGDNHPFCGGTHSPESIQKMSDAHSGKILTETHKQNISKTMTGRELTDTHKQNMSDARSGENHHFYGKELTGAHKQNISDTLTGRKFSLAHKQNISASKIGESHQYYGLHLSECHRRKISNTLRSKFPPDGYDVNDPRHFLWERVDTLMFTMLKEGTTRVSKKILMDVYGDYHLRDRNVAKGIARKIFEYGWNPLEDDRWLRYTEERSNLVV